MDDVGVTKRGRNTKFGREALGVFFAGLLGTTAERFDSVKLFDRGVCWIGFMGYSYYSKST